MLSVTDPGEDSVRGQALEPDLRIQLLHSPTTATYSPLGKLPRHSVLQSLNLPNRENYGTYLIRVL